jgi:hypothetical protein
MLSVLLLASLLAGLLLGVYAMLTGVERQRPGSDAPRARLSPPSVAAFLTLFGLVGYLLLRFTAASAVVAVVAGAVAAAAGVAGTLALIAKWAIPSAAADPEDERYVLQGTPAKVTRPIGADEEGEVTYAYGGAQYATLARSFDDTTHDEGDDVIIDRIEDGIAYVEAWAVVEKRL